MIPSGFSPIESSATNIIDPSQQAQAISAISKAVDGINDVALATFQGQCGQWTAANLHNRDVGQPLAPKPQQPAALTIVTIDDPSGNGTIWLGTVDGPLMGSPCPDLPALITNSNPPGTANIGAPLGGPWYACQPDDTMPNGAIYSISVPTKFAAGYLIPPGQYAKTPGMIGAWYLKVA